MSRIDRVMAHLWSKNWSCLRGLASKGPNVVQTRRTVTNAWTPPLGWRSNIWRYVKLVGHVTNLYLIANKRRRKPLIMYGLATALWEKEKISDQEIQKCLHYYEDRVAATNAYVPTTPAKEENNSSSSSTSFFSWFLWQTKEKVENEGPVDEKELRRQEMVARLTAYYTEKSKKKRSELPLVGIHHKVPMPYRIGSMVIKATKASVVKVLKQAAAISQVVAMNNSLSLKPVSLSCCEKVADLSCIEVELHHHPQLIGEWSPVPLDIESTKYPLVGLHTHQSKVIDMMISFIKRPSVQKSLSSFIQSLDQFLSLEDIVPSKSLSQEANRIRRSFFQKTLDHILQEELDIDTPSPSRNNAVPEQCLSRSNIEYLSDWEMFVDQPTYMVFRKLYADTGLYQFKVIGTYDDIAAQDFLEVQINEELRKSWDHYVAKLRTVDYDKVSGCGLVHWVMKYPFPMSSREYVYMHKRWTSPDEDLTIVVNRSVEDPSLPESNASVRVKHYYSEMVIKAHTSVDQPGFNYELTYFDDPQVHIPSSCVKWVTTSAMPDFLSRVRQAALDRRASQKTGTMST